MLFKSMQSNQENPFGGDSRERAHSEHFEVKPDNLYALQAETLKNFMLQQRIDELLVQINTNRIFMNMVIHDMRNPTGAIEFGVKQSIDNLEEW